MLTIDINNPQKQCNLSCEFCYSWNLEGTLTLGDVQKITAENPSHRIVELGGGEPLLHPEIADIIAYLTLEQQKNVHIATNGTYLPASLHDLPTSAQDRTHMQISLHASHQELFGAITGKPQLFERVVEHIPQFAKQFSTSINTVIYQRNFEDIPNIVELVKQYSLPHRINLAFPVGRGEGIALLSTAQIAEVSSYLLAEKRKGAMIDSPLLHANTCPALEQAYSISQQGTCPATAGQKMYISPTGVSSCEFLPKLVQVKVKEGYKSESAAEKI